MNTFNLGVFESDYKQSKLKLEEALQSTVKWGRAGVTPRFPGHRGQDLEESVRLVRRSLSLALHFLTTAESNPWPRSDDPNLGATFHEEFAVLVGEMASLHYVRIIRNLDDKDPLTFIAGLASSIARESRAMLTNLGRLVTLYKAQIQLADLSPSDIQSAIDLSDTIVEQLESEGAVTSIKEARDEAEQVLQVTRRAAGATGEAGLALHFLSYSKRESMTADSMRKWAVISLVAVTCTSGTIAFTFHLGPQSSWPLEIARLAIVIPVGLLAAYLGRESSRHREASRWAAELHVQLLTFDAFIAPLDENQAQELRLDFGRRIFTQGNKHRDDQNSPGLTSEAAALVRNLVDIVRPAGKEEATK